VLLEEARRLIVVDVEPLPAVRSIHEALEAREVIWGTDNVFKRYEVVRGDVEHAFAEPGTIVVEGAYETGAQEQLYIEPNGMLASAEGTHAVTVWGSMQCPYYCTSPDVSSHPSEKVRVVQMETGGGFGGRRVPLHHRGHAALLSWSGRP
jgi:CO/xanthine dehydrogenase Mo-binding subunit